MKEELVQTAVRIPKSMLRRIDKLAESMSREGPAEVNRSDFLRYVIRDAVERLEKKRAKR